MNLDDLNNRLASFGGNITAPPINLGALMGQSAPPQAPQMPQIPFTGMLSGGPGNSFNPMTFLPAFRQWLAQRQTPGGNGELRNWMQQRPQRPGMPGMPRAPQQGRPGVPGVFPQFPMGFGGR